MDVLAGADEPDPQGVALHHVRLLRLGVQLDGVRSRVPRPGRAREGLPLRRRPARPDEGRAARATYNAEHGIWDCTRCYFCNERCPKGVDPRDAIAKLGAESITEGHRPRHGREARQVVRQLGADDRLAARDGARARRRRASSTRSSRRVRARARQARQGAAPFPPHVAEDVKEARALYDLVKEQGRTAPRASSRARRRSRGSSSPRKRPRRGAGGGRGMKVAYYKGCLASLSAKELDSSTQALAPKLGHRARGARVGHLLRRGRHPRGRARLLPPPERAHPRLRRGDRRGHADDDLQRLHAQPSPGQLAAQERRRRCASA